MPDAFVTMVTFQATGLDKIQSGLKAAQVLQKSITTGAKQYTQELKQTTRQIEAMGRTFRSKEFRDRVRETDTLVRAQERLTKTMERQASLARLMTPAGMAGAAGRGLSIAGGIAGGAAAAGLGMGLAGMQGTVPMARFQNQMDRLQYELGNLLTPYLNIATKATAKAANFLSRQDPATQTQMGGALVGGAALLGLNFLSNRVLGAGIGTVAGATAVSAGRGVMQAGGFAFNAARMGGLSAAAAGTLGYGTGGAMGAAGALGGGLLGFGPQAALTAGGSALYAGIQGNLVESRHRRATTTDAGGFLGEYDKKFAGMSGDALQKAVQGERGRLAGMDAQIGKNTSKPSWLGGLGRILNPFAENYPGWAGVTENEQRRTALAQFTGEKKRPGHRANALVGGDFGEIGSGYYGAMGAAEKLRSDRMDAGAGVKGETSLEDDVKEIVKILLGATGGGGNPQPNKVDLGHAIPNFG